MMNAMEISFSRDEAGMASVTFNYISGNKAPWGTCSLTFSANGSLRVCIHNCFQDASVVFGQLSLLANALNVETTSLSLSAKSTPEMHQREFALLLPDMVRDLDDLINRIEHYFITAAQSYFEWETKQCIVKNRHVCVKGSSGSFSIPFTMLIEMITDTPRVPVQTARILH